MAFIPSGGGGLQNPLTEDIVGQDHTMTAMSLVETANLKLTNPTLLSQQYVLGYDPATKEITYYDPPDGTLVGIAAGNGIEITGAVPTPQVNLKDLGDPTTATYPTSVTVDTYGRVTAITAGSQPITSIVATTGQLTATTVDGETTVGLPNVGTAATTAYPASITTDAQGRITAATAGTAPITSLVAGTGIKVSGNQITNDGVISVTAGTGMSLTGSAQGPIVNNDGVLALTQGTGMLVTGTNANKTIALPSVGTAGTYTYPTTLTTDAQGRISAITAGSAPTVYTGGSGISIVGSTVNNTGVLAVSAGSGISITGTNTDRSITNNGVLSVTGTTNQITANTTSGATTLSLPASVTTTTYNASSATQNTKGFSMVGSVGSTTDFYPQVSNDGFSLDTDLNDAAIIYNNNGAGNGFVISRREGHGLRLDSAGNAAIYGSLTINNGQTPITSLTGGTGISVAGTTIANSGILSVTGTSGQVNATTTSGATTVSLPNVGTAGTYSIPTSLTTDAQGRLSAVAVRSITTSFYNNLNIPPADLTINAPSKCVSMTIVGGGGGGGGTARTYYGPTSVWLGAHGGGGGSGYRCVKNFTYSTSFVINSITIGTGGAAGTNASGYGTQNGTPGGRGGTTIVTITIDGVKQSYMAMGGYGGGGASAVESNDDGGNGGAGFSGGGGGATSGYSGDGARSGAGGQGDYSAGGQDGTEAILNNPGTNVQGGNGGTNYNYWQTDRRTWGVMGYNATTSFGWGGGAGGGPYGGYYGFFNGGDDYQPPAFGQGGGGYGGSIANFGTGSAVNPSSGAVGHVDVSYW
jgi:hypothetical protein